MKRNGKVKIVGILGGAGAVAGVLALVIATRPDHFHVERSITIAAPPESVYAKVNDLHAWTEWSPYEKLDPSMTRTYSGPASGNGASYAWKGGGKVGRGQMTIEDSQKPSRVALRLEFIEPFAATNSATFDFVPSGEGTKVTWAMDGRNTFATKAFHLVFDMDKLVGSDFEHGLESLKTQTEAAAAPGTQAAR